MRHDPGNDEGKAAVTGLAPNPEFGERVDAVWDNARGWIGGVAEEAGDAAEDVAGGVREAGERAGEEVEELGEETR